MELKLRSVESNPVSLVEKVRNLAVKREQQAATAASRAVAQELSATAKSYRALAEALAKEPDNLLDKPVDQIDSKLESKIG